MSAWRVEAESTKVINKKKLYTLRHDGFQKVEFRMVGE